MTAPNRPELDELFRRAKATVEAMSPEERAAMWQAQRESWVHGEREMGESAVRESAPDAPPEAARERVEAIYWLLQSQDEISDHGLAEKIEAEIIAPLTAKLDAANARADQGAKFEVICRRVGVCMTCALQVPEPYGCSDCLNTGWAYGAPLGYVGEASLATARAERDRAVADAVAQKREACAIVVEIIRRKYQWFGMEKGWEAAFEIADAIRARATASPVKREGE